MKIICSNIKCKYLKKGKCTCNNVELRFSNITTLNQGRKDILECKSFELDKEYEEMTKKIKELMEENK